MPARGRGNDSRGEGTSVLMGRVVPGRSIAGFATHAVLPASDSGSMHMQAPSSQLIKEIIVRELNLQDVRPEEIDEQAPLFGDGLGLDSLDALQLAMALEEHFGIKIPEGEEARRIFRSVTSITEYVSRAVSGPE